MIKKIIGILICLLFITINFSNPVSSKLFDFNNPPYIPNNPNPTNNSNDIGVNISLNWIGGDPDTEDTVTYDIYFGTDPNPIIIEIMHPTITYNPVRLEYDTQYYWRIDSMDNHGLKTIGNIWTFHTKENDPPNLPSNPNPSNGSTSVDVNTDLSWVGDDPDNDIVVYDVYFGTDSNPPNVELDYTNTTFDLELLDYNTKYYWRIIAWDIYENSTIGPIWNFNTTENNPPYIPSNPNPSNGSTSVDVNTDLSWNGGDPDISDIVLYDIYFGNTSNPTILATGISDTTYDLGQLDSDTNYYWYVNSTDNKGYTTKGPKWVFETSLFTNDPPGKPSKPHGISYGMIRVSYTFSSITSDADNDQIYYKFDWDDGTDSGWKGPFNSNETVYFSHVWTTIGGYNIKVKAKDINNAESVWSDPLTISMPRSRSIDNFNPRLLRLIQRFPIIEYLL